MTGGIMPPPMPYEKVMRNSCISKIQKSIFEYIHFLQKVITISQEEMWKTKQYGGIKLINVQIELESSKSNMVSRHSYKPTPENKFRYFYRTYMYTKERKIDHILKKILLSKST